MHCKAPGISGNLAAHEEEAIRNRVQIRMRWALLIGLLVAAHPAGAADLSAEATRGFDRYVRLTEGRIQGELKPGGAFLWLDGLADPRRSEAYSRLQRGEVITARLLTDDPSGQSSTRGALIHHWVGTVFIPGASLPQALALVQDYDHHSEYYKPEVQKSKTLEHAGVDFKVYLRLMQKKIITVVLDTEYTVHYQRVDSTRAVSSSFSTRISEVAHPGEANEQALPPGKDDGFLWRLNSYWRFSEANHGVYIQCEAVSLTRDIPAGLNWLVAPFIESIPKESLEFTLQSTRNAVLRGALHSDK
jgi:hypothetical protein